MRSNGRDDFAVGGQFYMHGVVLFFLVVNLPSIVQEITGTPI